MRAHELLAVSLVVLAFSLPRATAAATKPAYPSLSETQQTDIQAGKVVVYAVKDSDNPDIATATGIVEIRTTEAEIFDILASEYHSENASKAMKDCTINDDDRIGPTHRRLVVTYLMKVGPTEIQWTVTRDLYEDQGLLVFEINDAYDNDIAWTQGYYAMFPGSTPDHVIIVYVSNLDTGRRIPQWLEEDLTQGSLRRYLKYLKTAAEAD